MIISNQQSNEQLCQPRWSVCAHTCAYTDTTGFSLVALGLAGIPRYVQQDSNETGMT